MKLHFTLASMLLAFLAGCSQAPTPRPSATPAASTGGDQTKRCSNTTYGFSVSYPEAWRTNDGSVLPACSAFDPHPLVIPRDSEIPFELAVVFMAQQVPFQPTATSSQFERVLSSERLKVAGRNSLKVEVEATGEGLADRGMRSVRYEIDLGKGRTLVAVTHDANEAYVRNREILSRMVQTLSFP